MAKFSRIKTIFPHRYSKRFYSYYLPITTLWKAIMKRLTIEKDALILITGDTGTGKSNLCGNILFKHAMKTKNIVLNDDSMMFIPKEDFIINPDEFAVKMITKAGNALWIDEARDGVSRRNWASQINKTIISRKNKNRKLRKAVFLLLPYEAEVDPQMAKHIHIWIWVKTRGIAEVYCKRSGIKGGSGLNIQAILDREARYLKENPKLTQVLPIIHPEYLGRIKFGKLTANLNKLYLSLVEEKKAMGELSDEEKIEYGIEIVKEPKEVIIETIEKIKNGDIVDRKTLWNELENIKLEDDKKLKLLNFHLKLEGWDNFNKIFDKSKLKQAVVDW